MANPDDFEIIPDTSGQGAPPSRPRWWLWLAGAALLFVFAFAVGVGWTTLADRLGGAATEAPLVAVTSQPVATFTPTVAASPAASATAGNITTPPTANATPLATPTPLPSPSPTAPPPTRVCAVPLDPQFVASFDPGVLGCPVAPTSVVWAAYESFERGAMLWRSDTNLSYILFGDGSWAPSNETWNGQEPPWRGETPAGLYRPERGFGYIWGVREDVFTRLGWATMPEKGFCAAVQSFEQGFALASVPVPSCTAENLYNQATDASWRPLLLTFANDGRWRSGALTGTPGNVSAPAATATMPAPASATPSIAAAEMRPSQNGVFSARRGQPITLDGRFEDWPGPWQPVSAVIQGREQWSGPNDLSGVMQIMWAPEGLYLAVQITDDVLRPGPDGSDQWQGDGVELQFDRRLTDDFADTRANDDDTQIGLAPDAEFQFVRGYRWLPLAAESRFDPPGVVATATGQYALEVLIPWLYFDVSAAELQPGLRYGFNLSINDNDGDTPAQQTVLSASTARTTHDNPTEWGTLMLGD
ncbi:MAG TPA: hypothetical protein DCL15_18165 [Chloroflexi bacterium]|nr:hypothetical protein [Chloroflexota bacterium]HHW87317.1 hypothetical protein [Chloroflexota bacterium]